MLIFGVAGTNPRTLINKEKTMATKKAPAKKKPAEKKTATKKTTTKKSGCCR